MKLVLKYSSIIILFIILIYQTRIYNDFTASNSNLIILPCLIVVIFINIILLYYFDYKKVIKRNVTNYLLIILFSIFGINIYKNIQHSKKEIFAQYFISPNFQLKSRGYQIKLYKDKTYEVNEYWHGKSEHYFGKYKIENDVLEIYDSQIQDKTEMQLTTKYKWDRKKKEYKSIEKGFSSLKQQK